MDNTEYFGKAIIRGGRILTAKGSIQQLSNWADNIIRFNGSCNIEIEEDLHEKTRKHTKDLEDRTY